MELDKVRVLHLTNNLGIGGVQKVIYQLCAIQREKFERIIVASSGGCYENRIGKLGIKHYKINDLSDMKITSVIKNWITIKNIVKENQINVIHCHHRMAVFYAKLLCGDLKIIYNNHTIYSDKKLLTHALLKKNVLIIADGEKAKKNVIDFFDIPESKIKVITNAVEPYDGEKEEILEIAESRDKGNFIVMNASRLHPQKGIQYFLDAAKTLINQYADIDFFIVGDGPLQNKIANDIAKNKLHDRIHLLGFKENIKNVISQADILVLSSVYEGLPLTPMEAFSVGKSVIGSNIEGTNEVITNEANGLLFETKNPKKLAACIEKVYKDRDLLKQLNLNAYKSYQEKFGLDTFSKKYLEFYTKM